MGTSRAANAPPTKKWNKVIGTLNAPQRIPSNVLNVTFSVAMTAMPTVVPVSTPIIFGISEGLKFALDVKDKGLRKAVKNEALRVSEKYLIPSISDCLWNAAASKIDPTMSSTPFGRLAEVAFKKTMNQIMSKGAEAMAEEAK